MRIAPAILILVREPLNWAILYHHSARLACRRFPPSHYASLTGELAAFPFTVWIGPELFRQALLSLFIRQGD